jgi:hypothetical protein
MMQSKMKPRAAIERTSAVSEWDDDSVWEPSGLGDLADRMLIEQAPAGLQDVVEDSFDSGVEPDDILAASKVAAARLGESPDCAAVRQVSALLDRLKKCGRPGGGSRRKD